MMIVWGTTHAGKTDEVPGLFHVVTQFGHVYYIPLIPTGSYVVFEKNSDGSFRGTAIPISFKSWLLAWMRAGCIIGFIVAVIASAIMIGEAQTPGKHLNIPLLAFSISAAIATVVLLVLSYKMRFFTHASYERAVQLAQHAGLTEMGQLMIEVAYGRLSPEQADAKLASLDQQVFDAQVSEA